MNWVSDKPNVVVGSSVEVGHLGGFPEGEHLEIGDVAINFAQHMDAGLPGIRTAAHAPSSQRHFA